MLGQRPATGCATREPTSTPDSIYGCSESNLPGNSVTKLFCFLGGDAVTHFLLTIRAHRKSVSKAIIREREMVPLLSAKQLVAGLPLHWLLLPLPFPAFLAPDPPSALLCLYSCIPEKHGLGVVKREGQCNAAVHAVERKAVACK